MALCISGALVLGACDDDDGPEADTQVSDLGPGEAGTSDGLTPGDGVVDGTTDGTSDNTIVDVAAGNADFSTLVAAITRAGLVDTLKGTGPFTVFAPSNQAFTDSGITDVNSVPVADLREILLYHVISGAKVMAAAVQSGPVDSAADLTLFLDTSAGVTINGGASVTGGAAVSTADIDAANGVIHVIDRVLLPPDIPTCATYGGLNQLVTAIGNAADLPGGMSVLQALKSAGPFTVFAPTDAAFGAITAPSDPSELRDVLLYHVVPSALAAGSLPAEVKANSLATNAWGNNLTLLFGSSNGGTVNDASVELGDIKCTNGVVHVVDRVLLPADVVDMATIAGLSQLVSAVGNAADLPGGSSLADALRAQQPYTVFAPTDAAFGAITVPSDPAQLRDVLLLHVVQGSAPVLSSQLPASADTLLSGQQLTFDSGGPTVSSAGTSAAAIGPADINVINGVVHVIDKVLLP